MKPRAASSTAIRSAALGRRARMTWAACTNSVLRYLLPRLEILPRIVRSPVDSCFDGDVYFLAIKMGRPVKNHCGYSGLIVRRHASGSYLPTLPPIGRIAQLTT